MLSILYEKKKRRADDGAYRQIFGSSCIREKKAIPSDLIPLRKKISD